MVSLTIQIDPQDPADLAWLEKIAQAEPQLAQDLAAGAPVTVPLTPTEPAQALAARQARQAATLKLTPPAVEGGK